MNRSNIIITGLIGLVGAIIVTILAVLAIVWEWTPVSMSRPLLVWGLFTMLTVFSILEIPVMIFGMRRIANSVNPRAKQLVLVTNAGYVLFGAVYGVPFILLTGYIWTGVALATLSLVRLITSIIFLPSMTSQNGL